jgi:hypothetical protein
MRRFTYYAERLDHCYMLPEKLQEIQRNSSEVVSVSYCEESYFIIVWRQKA